MCFKVHDCVYEIDTLMLGSSFENVQYMQGCSNEDVRRKNKKMLYVSVKKNW